MTEHLSLFWLPSSKNLLIKSLEAEFSTLVIQSIQAGKISLPPIPEAVVKIQQLCADEDSSVNDIAECLIQDPSLAAVVIRIANSVIFNRRNITFHDINTAVSRLGIFRVRDIVTAQSIDQLKNATTLSDECRAILVKSAAISRQLGATMVLVTNEFKRLEPKEYRHLEQEKALLVGLLADIGLFCLVSEYHNYLDNGNYLDPAIALQIFHSRCSSSSQLVLKQWGFDQDYIEVATNELLAESRPEVSYLDIARIANHLLMFRNNDDGIDDHEVEINVTGAEVLYSLTNLSDMEFNTQINDIIKVSGL
ncbi:histidine kinase [Vibrio sp. 10N.286.49.B3]|uniref:HDOD domain-containing protein n=1 Tax=Vibrio sp. 10N.286.49.B3 TaxID=1880855 RepID=UPI000C824E18|nr:HDOD domain-containing protein [Vibrio sp. 10N.286.49.B3]PMH46657.1 histidine kinase [Vibrio sp. 10N.286.49.B3]